MKPILLASVLMVGSVTISAAGLADDTSTQTHPRIDEINARLSNQSTRISKAEADQKITALQAGALDAADTKIATKEAADESQDNGHLTKADQNALNRRLNKVSAEIATGDKHPRVAEVNARLADQNARINRAEKNGKLTATEVNTLQTDDAKIKTEEKSDETDKGSLTKAAWKALNQLLNKVSTQITDDTHPRVAEVDKRLDAQENRITRDEDENKITATEADKFREKDATFKSDEKFDRSQDDGHLTKADQQSLNQDIGRVGHEISHDAGTTGSHTASNSGTGSSHGGSGSSHSGGHK